MYVDHIGTIMADYLSLCSELLSCNDKTLRAIAAEFPGPEGEPARRILWSRRGMPDGVPHSGKPGAAPAGG